jgi:30S ribosomal protein S31
MGKGDKKTKRGKIALGSFGKLRPKRSKFRIRPKAVKNSPVNNIS